MSNIFIKVVKCIENILSRRISLKKSEENSSGIFLKPFLKRYEYKFMI